jgi:hypothetical protein
MCGVAWSAIFVQQGHKIRIVIGTVRLTLCNETVLGFISERNGNAKILLTNFRNCLSSKLLCCIAQTEPGYHMKLYNANLIRVHRKLIRSISELNDHFMITSVIM